MKNYHLITFPLEKNTEAENRSITSIIYLVFIHKKQHTSLLNQYIYPTESIDGKKQVE